MDFYKSSLYIYNLKFPMRNEYLSQIGDYKKRLNSGFSFINSEFNILLKKNRVEEFLEEQKKKKILMKKLLEEKKQKKIKYEINKHKKIEMNKQITKSVSNNSMLLDIMTNCKPFIKYLNLRKKSRNNNFFSENNFSTKNSNSNLMIKTQKNKGRNTFMTELSNINFSFNLTKTGKNNNKTQKYKIRKFKSDSVLKLKQFEFNGFNKKRNTMKKKNFSDNNLLVGKLVKHHKFRKPKINLKILNDIRIKKYFFKSQKPKKNIYIF